MTCCCSLREVARFRLGLVPVTLALLVLALFLPADATLFAPALAAAQSTGGSFGGGSYGAGTGGAGGGSYGAGTSGAGDQRFGHPERAFRRDPSFNGDSQLSADSTQGGGKSVVSNGIFLAGVLTFALLTALMLLFSRWQGRGDAAWDASVATDAATSATPSRAPTAQSPLWGNMDVTAISLGLDSRARPFVQKRLVRLAGSGATGTSSGLVRICREASALLISVERAWLYAGAKNYRPMSPPQAERGFRGGCHAPYAAELPAAPIAARRAPRLPQRDLEQ